MFDAKRMLGQFIATQVQGKLGRGHERFGGRPERGYEGGRHGASTLSDLARNLAGDGRGAMAGGLASLVFGSKKGRKLGGSAAKLGGIALIGSLAYQAYENWRTSQGQPAPGGAREGRLPFVASPVPSNEGSARTSFIPQPAGQAGSAFSTPRAPLQGASLAPSDEADQQVLSRTLLRAMIAAAKADGHIDSTEQAAIFGEMDKLDLDTDDKAFVIDELRAPLDLDAIAGSARTLEEAVAIYTASLLAIDVDNAAERGYLALLAARLGLDEGLVAQLHATIEDAARLA